MKKTILLAAAILTLAGCEEVKSNQSADEVQEKQTKQMHAEATRQVGMPAITNFQELKFTKMILELRDKEITTYTYTVDKQGGLHFVCQSVGFGLPYSTQMTNPQKVDPHRVYRSGDYDHVAVPQPEPNGLFLPDNVDATWILCLDEADGNVKPVYSEPQLMVSPFELKSKSRY